MLLQTCPSLFQIGHNVPKLLKKKIKIITAITAKQTLNCVLKEFTSSFLNDTFKKPRVFEHTHNFY